MPLAVSITATRTFTRRKTVNFTLNDVDAAKLGSMNAEQKRIMAEQIVAASGSTWDEVPDTNPPQAIVIKTA